MGICYRVVTFRQLKIIIQKPFESVGPIEKMVPIMPQKSGAHSPCLEIFSFGPKFSFLGIISCQSLFWTSKIHMGLCQRHKILLSGGKYLILFLDFLCPMGLFPKVPYRGSSSNS